MRTSRLDTYALEGSTANGLLRTNPYTVSGIVRVVFSIFFLFLIIMHYCITYIILNLHNLKLLT